MTLSGLHFQQMRQAFATTPYPSLAQRRAQLQALKQQLLRQQHSLCAAANADFGQRADSETRLLEDFANA